MTDGAIYEEYMATNGHSDSENVTPPPPVRLQSSSTSPSPLASANIPLERPPAGEKPRMSYAQMIAEALMTREDRMLTLSEIYQAINRRLVNMIHVEH